VVLGRESGDREFGLCNAVILAEPGAPFLQRWHNEYRSFRSKGHDKYWGEHSVEIPLQLAKAHPGEVTILAPKAFFWPTWQEDGLKRIFASTEPIPDDDDGVYANHLWESHAWFAYLHDLTPARVRSIDSNFHFWVRPLIADLPDDFGARSTISRMRSDIVTRFGSGHIKWHAWKLTQDATWNVRRALSRLRARSRLLDRLARNRHRYIDKALAIAATGAKVLGPRASSIHELHRRRIFQSIYRERAWGTDGSAIFFSGVGSRGEHARRYVEAMAPLLARHADENSTGIFLVDLGCGDFTIGSGLLALLAKVRYIGCDIVPELIAYNQAQFGRDGIEFRILDIVNSDLPDGDVCLVRQVLQHLSNSEIFAVLPKLAKYRHVYITEAHPLVREGIPNPDKPLGAEVRFDWRTGRGRGVELDLPPWNLTLQEVARTDATGQVKESVVTYRVIWPMDRETGRRSSRDLAHDHRSHQPYAANCGVEG
jgi:SAM-dependent methyltransferase